MTRNHLIAFALVSLAATACIDNLPPDPTEPTSGPAPGRVIYGDAGWVAYKPNVRFVEEEPGYSGAELEDDTLTLHLDRPGGFVLAPGDVVIGYREQPHYFRTVVSTKAAGDALVVDTAPAALRDAVAEAEIAAFVPVLPDGEQAPVLPDPGVVGTRRMRPRPDVPGALQTAVATPAVEATVQGDRTLVPFNLASRNLLTVSVFGTSYALPLQIKTSSDSRFAVSAGYTIRLSVSGDHVYFRAEERGSLALDLGVVISGAMSDSVTVPLWNGKLASFDLYGISGSVSLDVDTTVTAATNTWSERTGFHLDRAMTAWVQYDSAASTPWTRGGTVTGTGATYDPLTVNAAASGHLRFGLRSAMAVKLGAKLDAVPLGVELDSSVTTTIHPELDIDVAPGSYDVDACLGVRASISDDIVWFLNALPGFDFDDTTVLTTSYDRSWALFSACWNALHG